VLTPYDWQEGIGNRASYVEHKLVQGAPVLAVSLAAGIMVFTYRRQSRKIFEIYDRLGYSAIGQQNDVEALRLAAIDFAHQEGFVRSTEDVTIQRVVTALSQPIKKAFGDFGAAPIVVRSVLAEVGATPEEDRYYLLDYDGDYRASREFAVVAGDDRVARRLREAMPEVAKAANHDDAIKELKRIWLAGFETEEDRPDMTDLHPEIVLIHRSDARENRFQWLQGEDYA